MRVLGIWRRDLQRRLCLYDSFGRVASLASFWGDVGRGGGGGRLGFRLRLFRLDRRGTDIGEIIWC